MRKLFLLPLLCTLACARLTSAVTECATGDRESRESNCGEAATSDALARPEARKTQKLLRDEGRTMRGCPRGIMTDINKETICGREAECCDPLFSLSYVADKAIVGFDNRTTTKLLWGDAEQLTREAGNRFAHERVRRGQRFRLFGVTYTPMQRDHAG